LCYQAAWLVTGQSASILSDIQNRFPEIPSYLLSNGVDVNKFSNRVVDENIREKFAENSDQCVVLYAGLHGLAQGLSQVLDVAEQVANQPRIRFVLVGDGPEKSLLISSMKSRKLDNVVFLDPVPANQVSAMLLAADILLVTLKEYIPGAVPSKIYESMASGKPIVLVANGEPADIVRQYQAGLVVEPQNINSFAQALTTLSTDPVLRNQLGINGRKAAEEFFNRDKIVAHFIQHLEAGIQ
jgi:glycosyltransferase involved in cell wall biosynthesis